MALLSHLYKYIQHCSVSQSYVMFLVVNYQAAVSYYPCDSLQISKYNNGVIVWKLSNNCEVLDGSALLS